VKAQGSEPAATNAPVDRSVHWMGFITVHFFLLLITVPFLFFLVLGRFSPGPDLPPCSLSYLLSAAPTFVLYLLSLTEIVTLIISYAIHLAT